MKIRIRFLFLLAASLVLVTSPGLPQSNSTDEKLSGSITDPAGAAIPGAHITAESANSSGAAKLSAVSSADGTYTLTLPAGRYRVYVSQESFITRDLVVELAAGESRTVNLRLALQPLSSSVAVTAQ